MAADTLHIVLLILATRPNQLTPRLDDDVFFLLGAFLRRFGTVHHRLLQMHVHALRIEPLFAGKLEQRFDDVTAYLGRAGRSGHAETITATGDLDVESLFDLAQVFVELTAEVGEAVVIGGL